MDKALKQFPESEDLHWAALWLAFALDKPDEAQRLLAWAKGKSSEFLSLTLQARTLQSQGKLQLSSQVTQQALEMERNQKLDETAWSDLGQLAMVQADFGVCDQAWKNAATIPAGKTQNADVFAGFAFATCGDAAKSEALASELGKNYPLNTLIQKLGIPQIRARIELQRGNSAKAIEKLRPSEAYQLGYIADGKPVYLRGLAYLQAKQGPQAVTEFQKVIDHKAAFGASPNVSLPS